MPYEEPGRIYVFRSGSVSNLLSHAPAPHLDGTNRNEVRRADASARQEISAGSFAQLADPVHYQGEFTPTHAHAFLS